MIRFNFAQSTFLLEFERKHKEVTVFRKGEEEVIQSKYPYTTARLSETVLGSEPHVLYEATAGCLTTDKYSNEQGRLAALRKLTQKIQTKGLRQAMWNAYSNRRSVAHK